MKFGLIVETNEPEKAWNGLRFANASLKAGHEVKVFLMSAGVEIESITHERYNAKQQIEDFVRYGGRRFSLRHLHQGEEWRRDGSLPDFHDERLHQNGRMGR
jgi:hypothetical protein